MSGFGGASGGGLSNLFDQLRNQGQETTDPYVPPPAAGQTPGQGPGEGENFNYGQQGNYNTLAQDMSRNVMGNYGFGGGQFNYSPYGNPYAMQQPPPGPGPGGPPPGRIPPGDRGRGGRGGGGRQRSMYGGEPQFGGGMQQQFGGYGGGGYGGGGYGGGYQPGGYQQQFQQPQYQQFGGGMQQQFGGDQGMQKPQWGQQQQYPMQTDVWRGGGGGYGGGGGGFGGRSMW